MPVTGRPPDEPLVVGLLECDHVSEHLRPAAGGDYVDLFAALLATTGSSITLKPYDVVGGAIPPDPGECDGWVCTGSRHGAYDGFDWIDGLSRFVRDARDAGAPFAGICFGHQLLAHALGGRVEPAASGWGAGVRRLHVDGAASWMVPAADRLDLHFMHQDQVVELPAGAEVLGHADHCPVAAFRVGDSMFGIQAHPEFTAAYAGALIADREVRLGGDRAAEARATLDRSTDEATVARWIDNLLRATRPPAGSRGRPSAGAGGS